MKYLSILLMFTTTALAAAVPAGNSGGGWYVVNESLVCTNVCDIHQRCNIVGSPSDDDIAEACKRITDDCADGVLSHGQTSLLYSNVVGIGGILGTAQFPTGSGAGNLGCPNLDQCNLSFKYLARNMRYPSAPGHPNSYCSAAQIEVKSYRNHQKTGNLIVTFPVVQRTGPTK